MLIDVALGFLCGLLAIVATVNYWNFYRARYLLAAGGWSVFNATYGGTTSEWHYHTSEYKLAKWTLAEAYERQCGMDRLRRLKLPAQAFKGDTNAKN